ncbi:hypothetical protein [Paenibacillus sp. Soil522]|uniref:hypothetical protein n=1 Tax=Paenibacillus sp. Soil522 TaxID=1736388 RepID=UPI0006FA6F7E|nr:hypothetical protein [Paenibacillus sp. Soil522]KRE39932.1 hypothetical protein ASG81_18600 [Paenibacillus sp. Soil522]
MPVKVKLIQTIQGSASAFALAFVSVFVPAEAVSGAAVVSGAQTALTAQTASAALAAATALVAAAVPAATTSA